MPAAMPAVTTGESFGVSVRDSKPLSSHAYQPMYARAELTESRCLREHLAARQTGLIVLLFVRTAPALGRSRRAACGRFASHVRAALPPLPGGVPSSTSRVACRSMGGGVRRASSCTSRRRRSRRWSNLRPYRHPSRPFPGRKTAAPNPQIAGSKGVRSAISA